MAKKAKKKAVKKAAKKKLYKLKDSKNVVKEDSVAYGVNNETEEIEDDELTPAQLKGLRKAIKEAEDGKTMSWAEFKKRTAQWRTKKEQI